MIKDGYNMTKAQMEFCIEEIAKGNKVCLKEIYDEFKTPIFRFALSIVKNYEVAQDVAQETFIGIMASSKFYIKGTNPKAWIFSIARNKSLDMLKKSQKSSLLSDEEWGNIEDPKSQYFTHDISDILEALNFLNPLEREIITLYIYGGLKQSEISSVLKIPYIKVRSKYGYAIRKLKESFLKGGINI